MAPPMSGKHKSDTTDILNSKSKTNASGEADILESQKLDARLKYISDHILPPSPYLLSVPSSRPYHVSPHQANDWMRGSPFAAHEEQLQYLSFLSREGDENSILRAVGGWDNGNGEIMEDPVPSVRSATGTPQQGSKKKISLLDYKNKAAGQSVVKPTDKAIIDSTSNIHKAPPAGPPPPPPPTIPPAKIETTKKVEPPARDPGLKRSADTMNGTAAANGTTSHQEKSPPHKKSRISPSPTKNRTPKPTAEPAKKFTLPRMLSPTLPSSIEEHLAKKPQVAEAREESSKHKKSDSVLSAKSNIKDVSKATGPKNANRDIKSIPAATDRSTGPSKSSPGHAASSQTGKAKEHSIEHRDAKRDRSESSAAKPSGMTKVNGSGNPAGEYSRKEPAATGNANMSTRQERVGQKNRLLRLKIPKSKRTDVQRLLKMRPRPKKTQNDPGDKGVGIGALPSDSRETVTANKPEPPRSSEKRKREVDEKANHESSNKRLKTPNHLDLNQKPRTPIPPPFKSPALSHQGSSQKTQSNQNLTPRRDIKTAAMLRINSEEGEARTPSGMAKIGTPGAASNGTERGAGNTRDARSTSNVSSSTNISTTADALYRAWKNENGRLLDLGRTLKHDADVYYKSTDPVVKADRKKEYHAIATSVETVLTYMLGFTALDESDRIAKRVHPETSTWKSLLPYIGHVKNVTLGHTNLHGLVLQLEAICRAYIGTLDLERLVTEPIPFSVPANKPEDVPTPAAEKDKDAVDATTTASEGPTTDPVEAAIQKARQAFVDLRNSVISNSREASKLWLEGTFELPVEDLQRSFSKTWKASARAPEKGREKLAVGVYKGEYYLPLGSTSSPVEGVRAGYGVLGEWCTRENVDWKGKLGL